MLRILFSILAIVAAAITLTIETTLTTEWWPQFIGTPKMNVFKLSSYLHLQKQLPSAVANGGIPHTIGIRPEDIREDASGALKIGATLELSESLGRERLYHGSTVAGDELTIASHKEMSLQVGQPTTVSFNRGQVHMFDEKGIRLDF